MGCGNRKRYKTMMDFVDFVLCVCAEVTAVDAWQGVIFAITSYYFGSMHLYPWLYVRWCFNPDIYMLTEAHTKFYPGKTFQIAHLELTKSDANERGTLSLGYHSVFTHKFPIDLQTLTHTHIHINNKRVDKNTTQLTPHNIRKVTQTHTPKHAFHP